METARTGSRGSEDHMDGIKRRKINGIAEAARAVFKLSSPVDMEEVVRRLGGRIEPARGQHEATISKTDDGSFVIRLDYNKRAARRAFSLAHELGHLILHMGFGQPRWRTSTDYEESYARSGWGEEEYEANEFAAAFLMPRSEFREYASAHDVKAVAEHFGVSGDAALTRGRWLEIYPWS
jgi:Zn-dependent peptidase ImmA (M78 family)